MERELLPRANGRQEYETLQICLNYLDAHGVRCVHTTHLPAYTAEEVAAAEHMSPHRMAKTVVCQDNAGPMMVVVPADSYVDLEQLRTATGVPALFVVEENDLSLLFPRAELGAMPPLGTLFAPSRLFGPPGNKPGVHCLQFRHSSGSDSHARG